MRATRLVRSYAILVGGVDFCTGLGLVITPQWVLSLMGVPVPEVVVFLRWVGVFVGVVGASYWWALLRPVVGLRAVLELTILFRAAVGMFAATAIMLGWLAPAWWSVPVTDLLLALLQGWIVAKGVIVDD